MMPNQSPEQTPFALSGLHMRSAQFGSERLILIRQAATPPTIMTALLAVFEFRDPKTYARDQGCKPRQRKRIFV